MYKGFFESHGHHCNDSGSWQILGSADVGWGVFESRVGVGVVMFWEGGERREEGSGDGGLGRSWGERGCVQEDAHGTWEFEPSMATWNESRTHVYGQRPR